MPFSAADKKVLYEACVKIMHFVDLHGRCDTKWRARLSVPDGLSPSWRLLYKGPLPKCCSGGPCTSIMPTNNTVSKFNPNISQSCCLCNDIDNVFHTFCNYDRPRPLFKLIGSVLGRMGFIFKKALFIFGCKYSKIKKLNVP